MRDYLNQLDTELFLWLNARWAPWLDPIMVAFTERNTWIPAYALLVGWLIYRYRRGAAGLILTLAGAVALADQLASSVLKPYFLRPRPCHVPALVKQIHPVLDCGGAYGFVSSHAATTFALAMSLWLLLGHRYGWPKWVFVWAALVSYSRIYVAAHYPLDVLAGAGVGIGSAALGVWAYRKFTTQRAQTYR